MKVKLDEHGIIPTRSHPTDAGLDLYSPIEAIIQPRGGSVFIDTGVHIQLPPFHVGYIKSKSGLLRDHSIITTGTIDEGYTGSIGVVLFNLGNDPFHIEPYTKIAQLVIQPVKYLPVKVVDSLEKTLRGDDGFGSTGSY